MTDEVKCSFCGKSQREVARLVLSDKATAICDECLVVAFIKMTGFGIKLSLPNMAARLSRIRSALALSKSMILGGEAMSPTAEGIIDTALQLAQQDDT